MGKKTLKVTKLLHEDMRDAAILMQDNARRITGQLKLLTAVGLDIGKVVDMEKMRQKRLRILAKRFSLRAKRMQIV